MKKLSIALIIMGVVMSVCMADITAAVLLTVVGLTIPMYRSLVGWVYRHRRDRLVFVDFARMLISEE